MAAARTAPARIAGERHKKYMKKEFDKWNERKKEIDVENKEAFAILSQIRLIDTKRLHDRLDIINKKRFDEIRKAIRDLI